MIARRKRELRFEIAVACVGACLYFLNSCAQPLRGTMLGPFLANHFNDLVGGVVFPAYVNGLCIVLGAPWRIDTLAASLALSVLCALSWELIAPIFIARSTADLLDALVYVAGGLIYLALRRALIKPADTVAKLS